MCVILDKKLSDEQGMVLSEFLCEQLNRDDNRMEMNFSKRNENARVIVTGPLNQVMTFLTKYKERFEGKIEY